MIENTTFCQANCIVCVRDYLKFEKNNMSQEVFEKGINEVAAFYKKMGKSLKFVDFGGMGEPLLDNSLERKLKYLKNHHPEIRTGLTTNGGLLTAKKDLLCNYIDILKISNYGFSKASFEKIHRGSLVYEAIKKNIENFLSINKRPKVIMSFLMLPENKGEENSWKEYWESKCEELFIWLPHNWAGYGTSHTDMASGGYRSCGRPGKDFVIRANGDVSVCCWDFNREMSIGNINTASFEEICKGKIFEWIMDMHKNRSFFDYDSPCKHCDQLFDRTDALIYSSAKNYRVGSRLTAETQLLNEVCP